MTEELPPMAKIVKAIDKKMERMSGCDFDRWVVVRELCDSIRFAIARGLEKEDSPETIRLKESIMDKL